MVPQIVEEEPQDVAEEVEEVVESADETIGTETIVEEPTIDNTEDSNEEDSDIAPTAAQPKPTAVLDMSIPVEQVVTETEPVASDSAYQEATSFDFSAWLGEGSDGD